MKKDLYNKIAKLVKEGLTVKECRKVLKISDNTYRSLSPFQRTELKVYRLMNSYSSNNCGVPFHIQLLDYDKHLRKA